MFRERTALSRVCWKGTVIATFDEFWVRRGLGVGIQRFISDTGWRESFIQQIEIRGYNAMKFSKYSVSRRQGKGFYSYGLFRRLLQIEKLIKLVIDRGLSQGLRIVDFGCADELTLSYLIQVFGERVEKGSGLDIFPRGMPASQEGNKIDFYKVDLFRELPLPLGDSDFNIALCSAFYKHHPDGKHFIQEIWRVLERGGYLILLDPCPWVMAIGGALGYFELKYCPNIWNRRSLRGVLMDEMGEKKFEEVLYERYWIAPTRLLYDADIEKILPDKLIHQIGLHQSVVLKKT